MATSLAFPVNNYQSQSPLFGLLPGEIRNEIFALALLQYEDDAAAYPKDSYWYRPGFAGPRKSCSELLRTCKLAYAEGRQVFLDQLEWAFWFDRGPYGRSGTSACQRFFDDLDPGAARALQRVRFFTQMYWLEGGGGLKKIFRSPRFRPTVLTITIRYSDWWFWEGNEPLRMQERWLSRFHGSPGLKQLKVEYETLSWKKEEMMRIILRNKSWKLPILREQEEDGRDSTESDGYLSADDTVLHEWKWEGPSKLDGQTWQHHGPGETIEYVVVTDTWNFVEGPMSEMDVAKRVDSDNDYDYDNDYDNDNSDEFTESDYDVYDSQGEVISDDEEEGEELEDSDEADEEEGERNLDTGSGDHAQLHSHNLSQ